MISNFSTTGISLKLNTFCILKKIDIYEFEILGGIVFFFFLPFEVVRTEESCQSVLCSILQKQKVPLQQQLQKV